MINLRALNYDAPYRSIRLGALAAVALFALSSPLAGASTITNASNSVVRVIVSSDSSDGESFIGSGFKVAPGEYITNRHVVEKALQPGYRVFIVPSTEGEEAHQAQIKATSPDDLALLEADDISQPSLPLEMNLPDSGQNVVAIGYPHDLDAVLNVELTKPTRPDVTVGAVINTGSTTLPSGATITQIVHSASIWPGNSGGPLIDECGHVVGVDTWTHQGPPGLAQQNISISSGDLLTFLEQNNVSVTTDSQGCGAHVPGVGGPSDPVSGPDDGSPDIGWLAAIVLIVVALLTGGIAMHRRHRDEVQAKSQDRDEW